MRYVPPEKNRVPGRKPVFCFSLILLLNNHTINVDFFTTTPYFSLVGATSKVTENNFTSFFQFWVKNCFFTYFSGKKLFCSIVQPIFQLYIVLWTNSTQKFTLGKSNFFAIFWSYLGCPGKIWKIRIKSGKYSVHFFSLSEKN